MLIIIRLLASLFFAFSLFASNDHQTGDNNFEPGFAIDSQKASVNVKSGMRTPKTISAICADIVRTAKADKAPPLGNIGDLKKRFLDAHNSIRKRYNLPALIWDNEIARYAQKWAQYLKDRNHCQIKHRSLAGMTEGKRYGENLSFNWTSLVLPQGKFSKSPDFVVYGFAKECADYNYSQNRCASGKVCGHFTQVVWETSKRLGCGMVTCDGAKSYGGKGRTELWVCNYDPPGNWVSKKPF